VRFAWIERYEDQFPVKILCEVLAVSKSGFYAWKKRPVSECRQRREQLVGQIIQAHQDSRCIYGSPRVTAELNAAGVSVCENTVARYMREEGVESKVKRRFRVKTTDSNHDHPVAANVLDRRFGAEAPDRKWCVDITYVPTDEGWLYLSAVIDLCSRRIVGWAMADHLRAELCIDALSMAIEKRRPDPGLLHHSDRGVQYACQAYRSFLDRQQIEASMSRPGNCYDNAVMESFFGTLKTELIYHEKYQTRAQARLSIFEYIEVFYNRQRRHSAIGYKSPEEFEASLN
jgi:transposase InsO family protein